MPDETKSKKVPLYAQGGYDRELNYKLWSTYKSRFNAADRMQKKQRYSTWAVALLSAYVVIFSQITVMLPQYSQGGTGQTLVFMSSALSIIIIVISMLEASQNYSVRAYTYHQSGLDIAELYNELRALKTRFKDKADVEFLKAVEEISRRYKDILQRSDNHEDIDFAIFRAAKPDYEDHNLTKYEVRGILRQLWLRHYLPYFLCMGLPPILFGVYVFLSWPA